MPFERRVKVLQVSPAVLLDLLKGDHPATTIHNPIPEDAQLVRYQEDKFTGTVNLYLHSDSFPEVPLGAIPPYMEYQWISEMEVRYYTVYRCMDEPLAHTFLTYTEPSQRENPPEDEASCPWCDSHCTVAHRLAFWLKEQINLNG